MNMGFFVLFFASEYLLVKDMLGYLLPGFNHFLLSSGYSIKGVQS